MLQKNVASLQDPGGGRCTFANFPSETLRNNNTFKSFPSRNEIRFSLQDS